MKQHKNLGKAFKILRTMRHMSQEDVANRIGISTSYIGKIENGTRDPTWSVVLGIADALDTNVALVVALSEREDPQVAPIMPLVYGNVWKETNNERVEV